MSNCCLIPHQNFFQPFHVKNKLHFNDADDVDVCFVLDQHATQKCFRVVQSKCPWVDT
jgi:hypothetical protein